MSDTKQAPTQVTATTPVSNGELAPLAHQEAQTVDDIRPMRPDFLSDERDEEIRRQATELVDAILEDPNNTSITAKVYSLGSEYMQANTGQVSLMDAKIADVIREVSEGSSVNKTLIDIKTQLDLINPEVVSQTENFGIMGFVSRLLRRAPKGEEVLKVINERKDTVASTIEALKRHLFAERDKALRNAVELAHISDKLFETQRELQEAIYMGQLVWQGIKQRQAEVEDPVQAQALANIVNHLAVQVVDIQTVDTLNVQSRLAAEALIANARKIEQGVSRLVNVLLPAVATNLMVKAAATQQAGLVSTMEQITRSAERTIQDTARQTRQVATQMARMQSRSLVDPQALQKAANEVVAMVDEIRQISAQTEKKAKEASAQLQQISSIMRRAADPMTRLRHALEKKGG